jgi:transcriptional regulator with XRE-family HTH domain
MGRMLDHLGRACREARATAGLRQIDIASTAGTQNATVSRFETGTRFPIDLDRLVDAYAEECGVSALSLWTAAVDSWRAEEQ